MSDKRGAFVATKLKQCLRAHTAKTGVRFESLFNDWDSDQNGLLSLDELRDGLATLGLFGDVGGMTEDDVMPLMKAIDADGDGEVSSDEFTSFLSQDFISHYETTAIKLKCVLNAWLVGVRSFAY